MDGMRLTGPRCSGPLQGVEPVSTSPNRSKSSGRDIQPVDITKDVEDLNALKTSTKTTGFALKLQDVKKRLVRHYCEGPEQRQVVPCLTKDLFSASKASLHGLSEKEMTRLISAAVTAEIQSSPTPSRKSQRVSASAVCNTFDAVTTNPYQPKILNHLALHEPEIFTKLLVRADIDRLDGASLHAMQKACRLYFTHPDAEGTYCLRNNPETVLYSYLGKCPLPKLDPRCFDKLCQLDAYDQQRFEFLKSSYNSGGTGSAIPESKNFTYVDGETMIPFDYGHLDHRSMKVLDIGSAITTGALNSTTMYLVEKATSDGEPIETPAVEHQRPLITTAIYDMTEACALIAQSMMRRNIKEFFDQGEFRWYQRMLFVEPKGEEADFAATIMAANEALAEAHDADTALIAAKFKASKAEIALKAAESAENPITDEVAAATAAHKEAQASLAVATAEKELKEAKKAELNDRVSVIFNTDSFQPRDNPANGGPWKVDTKHEGTDQLVFESCDDWPEPKLPEKLMLTSSEMKGFKPPKRKRSASP